RGGPEGREAGRLGARVLGLLALVSCSPPVQAEGTPSPAVPVVAAPEIAAPAAPAEDVAAEPAVALTDDPALQRAYAVLSRVPLVDGHNDLPWVIREHEAAAGDVAAYDLQGRAPGHTDLPRLREG